jgi:hypothetical protein
MSFFRFCINYHLSKMSYPPSSRHSPFSLVTINYPYVDIKVHISPCSGQLIQQVTFSVLDQQNFPFYYIIQISIESSWVSSYLNKEKQVKPLIPSSSAEHSKSNSYISFRSWSLERIVYTCYLLTILYFLHSCYYSWSYYLLICFIFLFA